MRWVDLADTTLVRWAGDSLVSMGTSEYWWDWTNHALEVH